jgi:uncharacterized alkaline shock family protein YloU
MVSRQLPRTSEHAQAGGAEAEELTLRPEVVAKIAAMAARDVEGVALSAMPGMLPFVLAAAPDSRIRSRRAARASLDGKRATVDLWLKLNYGPPITTTVAQVRQNVRRRLGEMADVQDMRVNVHVTDLVLPLEDEQTAEE